MSLRRRLLKVEPLAASLGTYVSAVVFQRLLSLLRTVLFMWMLGSAQFGLWGLGCMVFGLGSTLATLAAFNGIVRYVSHYQARGRLLEFYRVTAWRLVLLPAAVALTAIALAPYLANAALGTFAGQTAIDPAHRTAIFNAAMLNAFLMALYLNMTAWMRGLRVYRLLSLADVLYGVSFLALGLLALAFHPTALAALLAHAASLAVVLVLGLTLLHRAVNDPTVKLAAGAPESPAATPTPLADENDQPVPVAVPAPGLGSEPEESDSRSIWRRLMAFSLISMAAVLLWQTQGYVSLWFVQRFHGEDGSGLFQAFFVLTQMIPILATTIWAVVYSHVSVHWEQQRRALARSQLEVSYKVVALLLVALGVILYVTAPYWTAILPPEFRQARPLLPWLLMHFLASANLGYVYVASNLRERPGVSVYTAIAGLAVNLLLAILLVPGGDTLSGSLAGARAAGLASLTCLIVAAVYLLVSRFGVSVVALAVSFSPLVLLLPPGYAAGVIAAVFIMTVATPWILSSEQKRLVFRSARQFASRLRRPRP